MTKINLKEFCVAKIKGADEDGIHFDAEQSKLEQEWKVFNTINCKTHKNLHMFLNEIRFENDMYIKVHELNDKSILRMESIKTKDQTTTFNCKKHLKNEVLKILKRNLGSFEEMVNAEKEIGHQLKIYNTYKTRIENKKLKLFFDDTHFITHNELINAKTEIKLINKKVLGIKINMGNGVISGFYDQIGIMGCMDNIFVCLQIINRYNKYINMCKDFNDCIEVSISDSKDEFYMGEYEQNCVMHMAKFFETTEQLFKIQLQHKISEEVGMIQFKYLTNNFHKVSTFINAAEDSKSYFCVIDKNVFELRIFEERYEIYINGVYYV